MCYNVSENEKVMSWRGKEKKTNKKICEHQEENPKRKIEPECSTIELCSCVQCKQFMLL